MVLAEMLTRLVLPNLAPSRFGRLQFWEYDELLGWAHKPNQKSRFRHPAFDVEVAINSDGLRDDELGLDANRARRALVLGDSFGWGFGVEHSERFDTLIESRHPDWEFVNASVSGYGTDQQYLWLLNNGLKYQPDFVLLLLYQNDFTNNSSKEQYWHFKPQFVPDGDALRLANTPVPKASFGQQFKRLVVGRTYLYGYLYRVTFAPYLFRIQAAKIKRDREKGIAKRMVTSPNEITGALLQAIGNFCSDNGIKFVVASVPGEPKYSEFLTEFSEANSINYLALDKDFSAVPEADYIIPRDRHWNALGHAMAADAIDEFLAQLNFY